MRRTYRFQFEKPKEENKPATKETKKRSRISPPRRKIYSFGDLKISEDCGSIDLTKKSIETFLGLPNLKYLIRLNLDSNPLRSFEGSPKLPNLRWLSARNSPISRNPYFKLMAVIVFGNNITTINNEKVMPQIHKQATAYRESLYPELLKGRIIANLRPLRFIDTKNEIVVNADPSILAATKRIIYKAPAVQEFERTVVERSKEQFRIPSVATICDGIIEREDEENNNYFPDNFMDNFLSQLHDLRVRYNAKYENPSSDYDDSEEEEAINESTLSQESINDASPIKPPQAIDKAKHLIQSESESDIKMSQLNIEEEINENVSHHSNLQDDLLIEEEEEQNEVNDQIGSENNNPTNKEEEEEEEEKNEHTEEEEEKIKNDDLETKEEEEEENHEIQTLENIHNEEEEKIEKENNDTENADLAEQNKDSNEDKGNEEENENDTNNSTNNEETEENKEGSNDPSVEANADTVNEEEEKSDIQNKEEEEEEKTDIQNKTNSTEEEEEKNENSHSAEDLDQNQGDQDENLSENSDAKSDD